MNLIHFIHFTWFILLPFFSKKDSENQGGGSLISTTKTYNKCSHLATFSKGLNISYLLGIAYVYSIVLGPTLAGIGYRTIIIILKPYENPVYTSLDGATSTHTHTNIICSHSQSIIVLPGFQDNIRNCISVILLTKAVFKLSCKNVNHSKMRFKNSDLKIWIKIRTKIVHVILPSWILHEAVSERMKVLKNTYWFLTQSFFSF